MNAIDGSGKIVDEPDWPLLLSDQLEISAAGEHWRRITTEMREREILSPANGHSIQRLVLSYLIYDRCSREVAERGAVLKPKRGNPRSISRLSPHYTAMREAASDAMAIEAELGISPRRRSGAAKIMKRSRAAVGADRYLKPVAK